MKVTRRIQRGARRLFRACLVDGLLDEDRVRMVVRRVAAANVRGSLPVLTQFRRLVALDRRRHLAVVESATLLSGVLRARVESGIIRAYGSGVRTTFEDNPALIGGMRVKVGSDVYDGSVRTALVLLQERF